MSVAISQRADGSILTDGGGNPIELHDALRAFFLARRPAGRDAMGGTYPETTNRDVAELARLWRAQLAKHWRGDIGDTAGQYSRADWIAALYATNVSLFGSAPTATYPKNAAFWRHLAAPLSIRLAVMAEQPSQSDVVIGALKHTITSLPGALADRAADALETAGGVVAAPVRGLARGLFGGYATPFLIGAAVVGAAIIVPRFQKREAGA